MFNKRISIRIYLSSLSVKIYIKVVIFRCSPIFETSYGKLKNKNFILGPL
jgi:hypothetical protein